MYAEEEDDVDSEAYDDDSEEEEEGHVPMMDSSLEEKYNAWEDDLDLDDIETELRDQTAQVALVEASLKRPQTTKRDIDMARSQLPSIFGNVEDLQYELDGLVLQSEEEKLRRKQLLVAIEALFVRITTNQEMSAIIAAKMSEEQRVKGNDFFKKGAFGDAIVCYDIAISLDSENPTLYTNRALARQRAEQIDESIADARKAVQLDASSLKGYVILIKGLVAKNQLVTASDTFNKIPLAYEGRPEVLELRAAVAVKAKDMGNTHFKAGQLDEAIAQYSVAIASDSTNHLLYSNRSAAYQSKKLWDKAAADADACLRHCKTFAKGYVHLGRCQVQLKRWADAEATLAKAAEALGADDLAGVQPQLNEISESAEAGKAGRPSAQAAAAAARAQGLSDAKRVEALKERGNELYKEEEYQEAIRLYSQAIALAPTDGSMYGNRAAAWLMIKEFKRAAADCDEGIKLEKSAGSLDKLRMRKATALANMGDLQGAQAYLEGCVLTNPASGANFDKTIQQLRAAQQHVDAGYESLGKSEFSRAKRLFQLAAQGSAFADNPRIRLGSARCHLGLGEFDDASREAQKVIAATGGAGQVSVDAYLCRAQALQATGATDLASKHLAAALQMDPDNLNIQQKVKALRRIIAETTRVRGEIDDALNKSDFDRAVRGCAEGLQIDKDSKKLMSEMHYRRAFTYSKLAKAQARAAPAAPSGSSEADDASSPKKLSEASWRRVLQDINSACYFDTTPAGPAVPYVFLKSEALQALCRFEEAVSELEQCYGNGAGKEDRAVRDKLQEAQFALKKSKRVDLYALLGVAKGEQATEAEIKTAYKKAALKWHPDRHSSGGEEKRKQAEDMFKKIQDANEFLMDAPRRKLYDQGYDRQEVEEKMEQEKQRREYGGFGGHGHGHGHGHGGRYGGGGGFGWG